MKYKYTKKMKKIVSTYALVDIKEEAVKFFEKEELNELNFRESFGLDDCALSFRIRKLGDIIKDFKNMVESSKNDVFEESGQKIFEDALAIATKISKESLQLYKEAGKEILL